MSSGPLLAALFLAKGRKFFDENIKKFDKNIGTAICGPVLGAFLVGMWGKDKLNKGIQKIFFKEGSS